ncbi:MAG: glutamine--fructose-6-phosphate transaminase (isomerizing), partial [Rhodocyclales bacterium]|nr:glutamine--fructose-6-phosphate transaminase (isomerizing) [Rhodocyclales bacterium]
MCGIVAAAATTNIVPVLIEGLKKLEYRGYDSAGIAVIGDEKVERVRSVGRVAELEAASAGTHSVTGIAHTRWATHGVPCERNAHPHVSGTVAVVHNGIIENYESLRAELSAQGYVFTSDTDTESIAHLVEAMLKKEPDLFKAVRLACRQLVGAYAIAVVDHKQPGKVIVAREGSPLLLGVSETGNYAASDASALLQVTRNMVYLENGDMAELTAKGARIERLDGTPVERPVHVSQLSAAAVELGNYQHYMQKEIFEQPEALANTIEIVGGSKSIQPGIFGAEAAQLLADVDQILILACGTSAHSGMTARYWLEAIAGIPCNVEIASEYRYRTSVANPRQLIVTISQSGETADTLAALRHAKALGQTKTLAICNVPESAIVRESALRFITRAGPEIGVASTKAFTTQLAALFLLTLVVAKVRNQLTESQEDAYIDELRHLPVAVNKVLELEAPIMQWAQGFA